MTQRKPTPTYTPEFRARGVRLFNENRADYASDNAAYLREIRELVRLHDLRHTIASIAAGQGASLPVIGKMLGHKQASTTQRYAHIDRDPALVVVEAVGSAIGAALSD